MPPTRKNNQNLDKNGSKEWSSYRRSQVITLYQEGKSLAAIAYWFDPPMAKSTVQSIVAKFNATKTVENLPRSGRPPKFNKYDIRHMKRTILQNAETRRVPLHQIQNDLLKDIGINMSKNTIRQYLKGDNITSHVAVRKPFISETNAKKRVKWCKERLNWTIEDWAHVCWSDECSVETTGARRAFVWRKPDEKFHPNCLQPTFKSGHQSVMMWAYFVCENLGPLVLYLEETIDAHKYCQVLKDNLLPFLEQHGERNILFMEDNAPIHTVCYSRN